MPIPIPYVPVNIYSKKTNILCIYDMLYIYMEVIHTTPSRPIRDELIASFEKVEKKPCSVCSF